MFTTRNGMAQSSPYAMSRVDQEKIMKAAILAVALAASLNVYATVGNNGGGNGGCGVGQQTNGCGSSPVPGPQGPKGDTGATGPQGPKGDTGATGATGAAGTNGMNGIDGKDGAQGVAGADGKPGLNGLNGQNGADGQDGKDAPQDAVTAAQLQDANNRIETVKHRAYAGVAGAMATASIPQAPDAGTKIVGAGLATFRGEAALAVGMSYRSKNGKMITKAAFSVDGRGGAGASVGAAFLWD